VIATLAALGSTGDEPSLATQVDWTSCQDCHADVATGLPSLAVFRAPAAGGQLEVDCRTCHARSELESLRGRWVHPVRPVADHLRCADCHVAVAHDAAHPPPLPRGDYKAGSCYACHKQTEVARHWPSRHDAGVQCRECHPAHAATTVALPASLLADSARASFTRSYDWLASNELCLQCHGSGELTLRLDGGFAVLNTVNYHELHVVRGQSLCVECHEPHGSTRPALMRSRLLEGGDLTFIPAPDGGRCSTNCHGVDHPNWSYVNSVR
jgi:predicted CXXCH cytochrome family protein